MGNNQNQGSLSHSFGWQMRVINFTVIRLMINHSRNWHACATSVPGLGVLRGPDIIFLKLVQKLSIGFCEVCFVLVVAVDSASLIWCLSWKTKLSCSVCRGYFASHVCTPTPVLCVHNRSQSIFTVLLPSAHLLQITQHWAYMVWNKEWVVFLMYSPWNKLQNMLGKLSLAVS